MSTQTKVGHTPGPWTAYVDGTIRRKAADPALAIIPGLYDNRIGKRPFDEANATLIAAAPELLEALRLVAKIMRFGEKVTLGELGGMAHDLRHASGDIKAAIAKAEGR